MDTLPLTASVFFGAMKGGMVNQKVEHINNVNAQKNAATLSEGMKTQEVINRNLTAAKDASAKNDLVIQMNARDAEGAAAAEAASTGASPEQAVREVQRNAAFAQQENDAELQMAMDQAELASYSVNESMNSMASPVKTNPYLNVLLGSASTAIPMLYRSGAVK